MSRVNRPPNGRHKPARRGAVAGMTCCRAVLRGLVLPILTIWAVGATSAAESGSATLQRPLSRYVFRQLQMGTEFRIVLYAADKTTANEAADAAYARVAQLNRVFSDYDPQSEAMRLCRSASVGQAVPVSHDLARVLKTAHNISRRSDGAFDVTIGPLTKLWRRARRQKRLPSASRLSDARSKVDYRQVQLVGQTVQLHSAGLRLDFGGIAKGYAADAALQVLRRRGIPRALIDAGGDIVAGEPPPGEHGWRIGIGPTEKPDMKPLRFILLRCAAVATSGDAYQHVEINSVRYSHIVDPRRGRGLTTPVRVTVIAGSGIQADAWASALSVLEPDRGLPLIEGLPHAAAVIERLVDKRLITTESKRFRQFVVP